MDGLFFDGLNCYDFTKFRAMRRFFSRKQFIYHAVRLRDVCSRIFSVTLGARFPPKKYAEPFFFFLSLFLSLSFAR